MSAVSIMYGYKNGKQEMGEAGIGERGSCVSALTAPTIKTTLGQGGWRSLASKGGCLGPYA